MKKRILALLLALVMLVGILPINIFAEDGSGDSNIAETVTVTVNFVYEHNGAMVTSPWSAQIAKGTEFAQTVSVPAILNFSVDEEKSDLPDGVTYAPGETIADPGTLTFAIDKVASDVNVVLYYKPENVNFTVKHHYQKVDSDDYDEPEVVTGTGSVEAYAEFAVQEKEGFYCLGKPDVILHGDNAVIDIYYNRHYYTMQFDLDGGVNSPDPIYAKYGSQFDLSTMTKPTKVGYNFDSWLDAEGNSVTIVTLTGDVTYKAKWSAAAQNADYKFVVWEQNANDDDYSYSQTILGNTMSGQTVYFSQLQCDKTQHIHSVEAGCYTQTCGRDSEHKHSASCFTDCQTPEHTHDDSCYSCVEHDGHNASCYVKELTHKDFATKPFTNIKYFEETLDSANDFDLDWLAWAITEGYVDNKRTEPKTFGKFTIYPNGEIWASDNTFGEPNISFLYKKTGGTGLSAFESWYIVTLNPYASDAPADYTKWKGKYKVTPDSTAVTCEGYDESAVYQKYEFEMNSAPELIRDAATDGRTQAFFQAILDNFDEVDVGTYKESYNNKSYTVAENGEVWGLRTKMVNDDYWFMKKLNGTWYGIYPSTTVTYPVAYDSRGTYDAIKDCELADHTHGDGSCIFADGICDGSSHTHGDDCCGLGLTEHIHTDNCYTFGCNITEHTHGNDCYTEGSHTFVEEKWVLKEIASGEVAPDGSTVINVYLDRKTYTLEFYYKNSPDSKTYENHDSITARWGEDISERYKYITSKTYKQNTNWSQYQSGVGPWTNYFGIMPIGGGVYFNAGHTFYEGTTYYYGEDLNGEYQLIFQVDNVGGTNLSSEDYFEFEGYTLNNDLSTQVGDYSAGAEIYYDRNEYNLVYMSGGNVVKTERVKYQQGLGLTEYKEFIPTDRPTGVEEDAVFVGWYKNPEGTVPFDFDSTTMPSNNVTVYAKWANPSYTVTTYLDIAKQTLYTYEEEKDYNGNVIRNAYSGQQSVEKYMTPSVEPENPPATENGVFLGWYYTDDDGAEQRFSFEMAITRNYDLYPKYTVQYPIEYKVRYFYKTATGIYQPAAATETRSVMFGTEVTELAKMGDDLDQINGDRNKYFPDAVRKTRKINEEEIIIVFYYEEMDKVPYTVKYVDVNGEPIADSYTNADNSYAVVTEPYKPIPGYVPQQFSITKELTTNEEDNVITFVYDQQVKINVVCKDEDGNILSDQDAVNAIVGSDYTAKIPEIEEHTFKEAQTDVNGTQVTVNNDGTFTVVKVPAVTNEVTDTGDFGTLTVTLIYGPEATEVTYTYYSVIEGTSAKIGEETVKNNAETVSGHTPAAVKGYEFKGWFTDEECTKAVTESWVSGTTLTPQKVDGKHTGGNYYAKFEAMEQTIEYFASEGGKVDPASETVTGANAAQGSTATANKGYRFDGWFTDEAYTQAVETSWVVDGKLTPVAGEDGTFAVRKFYAKFTKVVGNLTIKATGTDSIDENQSFIYTVSGPNGFSMDVVVPGDGQVTIADLPIGTYTVTAKNGKAGWAWRYGTESETVVLPATGATVDFTHSRLADMIYWLNGCWYESNKFGTATNE